MRRSGRTVKPSAKVRENNLQQNKQTKQYVEVKPASKIIRDDKAKEKQQKKKVDNLENIEPTDDQLTEYEKQREANIRRNKAILDALNLNVEFEQINQQVEIARNEPRSRRKGRAPVKKPNDVQGKTSNIDRSIPQPTKYGREFIPKLPSMNPESFIYMDCEIFNDPLSKDLKDAIDSWGDELPELFGTILPYYVIKPEKKNKYKMNKITPEDLKQGKYYQGRATEEKNISDFRYYQRLTFFMNLEETKEFFDEGFGFNKDLRWLSQDKFHIKLLTIMLKYHKEKGNSAYTLNGDLKILSRIFLLFNQTNPSPLWRKYSNLQMSLKMRLQDIENENRISAVEADKFILFTDVENLLKDAIETFNKKGNQYKYATADGYFEHMMICLIAIYVYNPPLRQEVFHLKFTTDDQGFQDKTDYILLKKEINKLGKEEKCCYFHLAKEKKLHRPIEWFDYPIYSTDPKKKTFYQGKELSKLLWESYENYKIDEETPRSWFITYKDDKTRHPQDKSIADNIRSWFRDKTKKKEISIGVNSLRSSYVSRLFERQSSYANKMDVAFRMRTSLTMMLQSYNKILVDKDLRVKFKIEEGLEDIVSSDQPIVQEILDKEPYHPINNIIIKQEPVSDDEEVFVPQKEPIKTIHEKEKELSRKYYNDNKDRINKDRREAYQKNKKKIMTQKLLRKLNETGSLYDQVIKSKTLKEYGIVYDKRKKIYISTLKLERAK